MNNVCLLQNDPFEALISFFRDLQKTDRNIISGIVGPSSNIVSELMTYVIRASMPAVIVSGSRIYFVCVCERESVCVSVCVCV